MLLMCTSTRGAVSIARASRSTTEVCDQPAGLSTTGSPASAASCTQRSSSPSSSVCRTRTSSASSAAAAAISSTSSVYVVDPYFSGSRVPRRPRLAPLSTWTVTSAPGWSRSLRNCGPRRVEPGLVGVGEDARVADPVQDDEPQRGAAGLLVHPHDRLDALPVPGVAGGQPHRGDEPGVPVDLGAGQQARLAGQLGGEDQPDGDRLAVPPAEVLHPFDGVAQRVPVVEELAHAGVVEDRKSVV